MCNTSCKLAGFNIAAMGSMLVILPSINLKPVGAFIHAFAVTTKTPERIPLSAMSTPQSQWTTGGSRFHPARYNPRKIA